MECLIECESLLLSGDFCICVCVSSTKLKNVKNKT